MVRIRIQASGSSSRLEGLFAAAGRPTFRLRPDTSRVVRTAYHELEDERKTAMDDLRQRERVAGHALVTSVVLLEFNELSPSLMYDFMAAGELPNFKKLHDSSHVYITDAEEQAPNLEPWIQWVTVHSGLPFSEHRVFHLGDGAKLRAPQIWDLLSRAGHKVWVCGSMNIRYDQTLNGAAHQIRGRPEYRPIRQANLIAIRDLCSAMCRSTRTIVSSSPLAITSIFASSW
jgi:hypothetical protein